jgi:hypothetical protein
MKRWSQILTSLLVAATVVNVAGVAALFILNGELKKAQPRPTAKIGDAFPRFSGVDLHGARWASADPPCRIVRMTDDNCPYCRQDAPSYASLLKAAAAASCEVIELAPQAGTMKYDPRPGVVQLKYIDADMSAVMFPFVTPQTVVLDRDWSLRMSRRGAFDDKSLATTMALLKTMAASGVTR